jgi:predicted anti-sigma-YlaC factor YlaD
VLQRWNRLPSRNDLVDVETYDTPTGDGSGPISCETSVELLSVVADNEANREERAMLDIHLDGCASCREVATRFELVDRRVRFRPAEPVPDLVLAVTATARPAILGRGGWMRPALAWVAVVLVAQNISPLVLGRVDGAEVHLARHLGAFGVALAIGFAYAAWRPHRAFGMLPFVAALVLTMSASAGFDLLDGGRTAIAETTHLAELVGLALLWMIAGSPGWNGWQPIARRLGHVART